MRHPSRQRILDAAARQFAQHGPVGATLDHIRADAQISVGALYHHFAGKEELYGAAWLAALEDYQAAFLAELDRHTGAEAAVKGIVRHHLRWLDEHPDGARLLFGARPVGGVADDANRAFFDAVRRWWRAQVAAGTVRPLGVTVLYALWLGPAQEYGRLRADGAAPAASREDVRRLADAAWRALRPDDPEEDR